MTGWAGAEDDWIQKLILDPLQKEDVIVATMRQPIAHSERKPGGIPSIELRDHDPSVLELPTKTEGIELEIKSDSKTVVEWINGEAKIRQFVLPGLTEGTVELGLRRRVNEWAVHIFGNTTKKLMPGRKGGSEAELTNGFKSGLVQGQRTLRVLGWELPRRRMRCGYVNQDVYTSCGGGMQFTKSAGQRLAIISPLHVGILCARVDRNRSPHTCVDLWVSCGSGVRCFEERVVCGRGRMLSLSYCMEHAAASANSSSSLSLVGWSK